MPIEDAVRVFQKYGVDISRMSFDKIRKSRNTLLQKYHPDAGGKIEIAQEINAAFDMLQRRTPASRQLEPKPQPHSDKWAWAGHSGLTAPNTHISRHDFADPNFVKKSMWQLSGFSNEEWTIYGFNGSLFTNIVVVYGSSKIFYYMAIAMIDLQTKGAIPLRCRAVFVHPATSPDLYLIYADGKYYEEGPKKFVLKSRDVERINRSDFIRKLPDLLDQLNETPANESELVLSE